MWFRYTKKFENSSTKSSTSFVDMRYMQNNGKNFEMSFDDWVITEEIAYWCTTWSKRSTTTVLLEFYEMVTDAMGRVCVIDIFYFDLEKRLTRTTCG